jgi:hypothetical protein
MRRSAAEDAPDGVFVPPGDCPVCGEWVPKGAKACPDCGSCARSGWREVELAYDGLDLPEWEEEQEAKPRRSAEGLSLGWRLVGALLLALLLWSALRR